MTLLHRRHFLGTLAAGLTLAPTVSLHAQAPTEESLQTSLNESMQPFQNPETLFLTWQKDPTTTITIQWVGPAVEVCPVIYYSRFENEFLQTASVFTKPYPNTDLLVYRCEITDLEAGSEYQFTVGKSGQRLRFRTMPAKANDTIHFVTGGDAGTGPEAIRTNIIAAKQEPYFAFIGGDLAYDNGRSPETFYKYLRQYREHMVDPQGRLIPMLSCPGNHEVDGGHLKPREKAPHYLSVFDGLFSETSYGVLDFGDYMSLVMLDTDHLSPVEGEQTDWLENVLKERQDRPHLLVGLHVPAYPSYREPNSTSERQGTGIGQRQHWCPLFERYGVDVVLEHHDHTFKRTHPLTDGLYDKYGIPYLGDGSWGKLRAPKTPEERPYLAKVGQAYHMSLHRFEGEQRFHMAIEDTGKVADVYMTNGKRPAKRG